MGIGPYIKAALVGIVAGLVIFTIILIGFLIHVYFIDTNVGQTDYNTLNLYRSIVNVSSTFLYMMVAILSGLTLAFWLRKSRYVLGILKASALSGMITGVFYLIGSVLLYHVLVYFLKSTYIFELQSVFFNVIYEILYVLDITGLVMLGAFIVALVINPEKKAETIAG